MFRRSLSTEGQGSDAGSRGPSPITIATALGRDVLRSRNDSYNDKLQPASVTSNTSLDSGIFSIKALNSIYYY